MVDASLKKANILIVDDNNANIDILECFLESLGYENLQSTNDPRTVSSLFHTFKPDIILLDLLMPYLNGFEVMDQLKEMVTTGSYLPVLVLTADITIDAKQKALAGGAKDFLSKPFDLDELQLRINNLLETRYLHQELENQNMILERKVKERTFDLVQANNKLAKANQELMVLDKAKNDFLNLISHELRTPLNGIMGFSSILKDEVEDPELLRFIQYLYESAQRLEQFSYHALLFTELRTRKRFIHKQEVLLSDITGKAIGLCQKDALDKEVSVELFTNPEVNTLTGDPELLQLCFDKLIDNAVRFSPAGKTISVRILEKGSSTVCEFLDQGPGYPENILKDPFTVFTPANGHKDRHTGLNLALVKLIMDAIKGRMEISNRPDGGALARLTFTHQR